ncbi:unnamed protein product [Prorocentrum cordatum]|uniref:Uncharacterized protein n=1 Tax=Prorocentrum cordatum TaxID=2364126 RepID=A0ABN9PDJ6_9DINO|nr:unnamed protein product [Polarella glacialis]CAK0866986.1 unnamed protein product [Polarella glacialis]
MREMGIIQWKPADMYGAAPKEGQLNLNAVWFATIDVNKDTETAKNWDAAIAQMMNVVQAVCVCRGGMEGDGPEIEEYPLVLPISSDFPAGKTVDDWEAAKKECNPDSDRWILVKFCPGRARRRPSSSSPTTATQCKSQMPALRRLPGSPERSDIALKLGHLSSFQKWRAGRCQRSAVVARWDGGPSSACQRGLKLQESPVQFFPAVLDSMRLRCNRKAVCEAFQINDLVVILSRSSARISQSLRRRASCCSRLHLFAVPAISRSSRGAA